MALSKSKTLITALNSLGIVTPGDVVRHIPYRYDDFSLSASGPFEPGQRVVVFGIAISAPTVNQSTRVKISTFKFRLSDQRVYQVVAFNRVYLRSVIKLGQEYTIIANFDAQRNTLNLINLRAGMIKKEDRLRPLYRLPGSIAQHVYHRLVQRVYEKAKPELVTLLPNELIDKYRLLPKLASYEKVHFPLTLDDVYQGVRVFKYEEALLYSLKTQLIRQQNKYLHKQAKMPIEVGFINDFVKKLPYKLSRDQLQAVRDIITDMNETTLMYRLLQGDVGSGKTIVAAIALFANYLRKNQGALMAPTDALAKQHYKTLISVFKDTGVQIALLVGTLTNKEKTYVKEGLLDGVIDIVIGTHALFSRDVIYQSLGLAVIDEQHRFGVNQRSLLSNKGTHADLLLLSATPIPRTLGMTLFGDMDITTIRQFPFLKRNVITTIHLPDDDRIMDAITVALAQNDRVFIVAPLIEDSDFSDFNVEALFEMYQARFIGKVTLLHGRLSNEDKDDALTDFVTGKRPIIVATSIIEVGIDVQDASLMIVYDAHRFGLASLHQLRGRIGRGGQQATFMLVTDLESPDEHERLTVLTRSNDGFEIAEKDLALRGPGEFIGVRQSGLPSFGYLNIFQDYKMLEYARDDARMILANPKPEHRVILDIVLQEINTLPYG